MQAGNTNVAAERPAVPARHKGGEKDTDTPRASRHLLQLGVAGALFTALCCLGVSALLSLLTAIGIGFLIDDAILLPALVMFLAVYVTGLLLGWRRHRRLPVLLLGVVAAVANFSFVYVLFSRPLAYSAVVLLVGVAVWDLIERRRVHL